MTDIQPQSLVQVAAPFCTVGTDGKLSDGSKLDLLENSCNCHHYFTTNPR